MPRRVELQYNPYIPQLQIVIDGIQPPDFSSLIQYFDEDIWCWSHLIINTIYDEIRDDFFLSFIGTDQDAAIIQYACEKCQYCIGFHHSNFFVNDSLPQRMGKLNQLIKKAGITFYEKTLIDATFLIPSAFQYCLEEITSIEINNLFCAVRVNAIGLKSEYDDHKNSVLFILAQDQNIGSMYVHNLMVNKPAFILIIGKKRKILDVTDTGWYIETPQEQLFDTIFDCFIQMPLVCAFRKCVNSIKAGNKISKELKKIICVEPIINVMVDKEVEVGKSIRIMTSFDPPIGTAPKLIYKVRNDKIASCDGLSVYGIHEGKSILEIYKTGSKQPFFTKEIKVLKRNRITKLILSEDTLLLGVNDQTKLTVDYYPSDADNASSIIWKSSDESVIKIDEKGNITAVGVGNCRVLCTAENISAQCACTVKPYLEELRIDFDITEDIAMIQLQELPLTVECIPCDCVDGEIIMISSNYDVVNIANNTLLAKNVGNATITIKNHSGRISRSFNVVVTKKQQQKKKSGFFKSLFS